MTPSPLLTHGGARARACASTLAAVVLASSWLAACSPALTTDTAAATSPRATLANAQGERPDSLVLINPSAIRINNFPETAITGDPERPEDGLRLYVDGTDGLRPDTNGARYCRSRGTHGTWLCSLPGLAGGSLSVIAFEVGTITDAVASYFRPGKAPQPLVVYL